jgi:hypothetical protein
MAGAAVTVALLYGAGMGQLQPKIELGNGEVARSWAIARESGQRIVEVSPSAGWLKLVLAIASIGGFSVLLKASEEVEDAELMAFEASRQQLALAGESAELEKNFALQRQAQQYQAKLNVHRAIAQAEAEMDAEGGYASPSQPVPPQQMREPVPIPGTGYASYGPPIQPQRSSVVAVAEKPETSEAISQTALDIILSSPFKSRAVFGSQRAGKSMFLAIAGKNLANRGVKVFQLNMLSFVGGGQDEDSEYTGHVYRSVRGDYSLMENTADKRTLASNAIALINEWWSCEEPSILLFDEWFYSAGDNLKDTPIGDVVRCISDKLTAIASSGMKRTKAAWLLCPLMKAGSLSDDGKQIKNLELLYITIAPSQPGSWQGQAITWDDQLFSQVKRNFSHIWKPDPSECPGEQRIAFVGDRWLPTGISPDMLTPKQKDDTEKHPETLADTVPAVKVKPTKELVLSLRNAGYGADRIVREIWGTTPESPNWKQCTQECKELLG